MDWIRWRARTSGSADEAQRHEAVAEEKTDSPPSGDVASVRVATRRDPFGRVLAPVRINGSGPFYFVVNSGANTIAITDQVARRLKVPLDEERPIVVHGVMGTTRVPVLRNASFTLGGISIPAAAVPVLTHAPEDSDGMLGLSGLGCSHIQLDFSKHHMALFTGTLPVRHALASASVPMDASHTTLIVIDTRVQGLIVKTIIDTGAQSTIGNLPLQVALQRQGDPFGVAGPINDTDTNGRTKVFQPLHPIGIGHLRILGARICYSQVPLFEKVGLGATPAMLLGLDVLSKMAMLSFDFRTRTLQFEPPMSKPDTRRRHARLKHN